MQLEAIRSVVRLHDVLKSAKKRGAGKLIESDISVLFELYEANRPLSFNGIYKRLDKRYYVDKMYRSLDKLIACGYIIRNDSSNSYIYYNITLSGKLVLQSIEKALK